MPRERELLTIQRFLRDLVLEPSHRISCRCRWCSYTHYRDGLKGKGRPISKASFFIYCLKDSSRYDYLGGVLELLRDLERRPQPKAVKAFLRNILRAKNLYYHLNRAESPEMPRAFPGVVTKD